MIDDRVRDDIAFIREAIEEGRGYAMAGGRDMLVWGVAVAINYFDVYAWLRGWSPLSPRWLWLVAIGLPWLYSLRRVWGRAFDGEPLRPSPLVAALRMLWLGLGIFLTTLGCAAASAGAMRYGWFNAVVAGAMGSGFFATAAIAGLPWLRWVAGGWWVGELAVFALREKPEAQLLCALLMLALLAGPGAALVIRRRKLVAA
jgi:hypothetical protein